MATGNGGTSNGGQAQAPLPGQAQGQAQEKPPQLNVLAQYIKDFSFENPNAPSALKPGQQPAINIQVAVNANPLEGSDVEVVLHIEGKAEIGATVLFNFELSFAGAFRIQNVPQESLHPVVMIECPRLLFPFAREIIASSVRNGGFPPLMLDPIDFVGLYQQRVMAQQQQVPPPASA
jgi:preprotein translocase subunit SecB